MKLIRISTLKNKFYKQKIFKIVKFNKNKNYLFKKMISLHKNCLVHNHLKEISHHLI